MSPMMPISKKFMTANGTCFTWRAPARDHLLVTGVKLASEFLDDLFELRSGRWAGIGDAARHAGI